MFALLMASVFGALYPQVFVNPKDANNRDITWHNSVALEGYVKRLSVVAVRTATNSLRAKCCQRLDCSASEVMGAVMCA